MASALSTTLISLMNRLASWIVFSETPFSTSRSWKSWAITPTPSPPTRPIIKTLSPGRASHVLTTLPRVYPKAEAITIGLGKPGVTSVCPPMIDALIDLAASSASRRISSRRTVDESGGKSTVKSIHLGHTPRTATSLAATCTANHPIYSSAAVIGSL